MNNETLASHGLPGPAPAGGSGDSLSHRDGLIRLCDGRLGLRRGLIMEIREPSALELPPDAGALPILDFIASDATLDRYDEVIMPSGWRLESYRRNPVFQNAHQYGDILFTLGKALITEVRGNEERKMEDEAREADVGHRARNEGREVGTPDSYVASSISRGIADRRSKIAGEWQDEDQGQDQEKHPCVSEVGFGLRGTSAVPALSPCPRPAGPCLFQRIQFATDVNPIARIAYGLYKGKFLNAVSVGFIPLQWEDGEQEEGGRQRIGESAGRGGRELHHSNTPSLRSSSRRPRRRYLEQELLEVSAVAIPANPNALALGLKSGLLVTADLRDSLELLRALCRSLEFQAGSRPGPSRSAGTALHHALMLARALREVLRRA